MTMHPLLPEPAQHTLGHLQCPACEALRRAVIRTGELGTLNFCEVWPLWFENKKQDLSPKTIKNYDGYYRTLAPFFGNLPLKQIHIGNIYAYRAQRQVVACADLINHEICALSQVLDHAGLWAPIAKHYKPLRVRQTGPGQAFLEEEALHLLQTASKRPKWRVAYLASVISSNTACGPGELRKLRFRDVDLIANDISIEDGAKNDQRRRSVPLNSAALWAMEQLYDRALRAGASAPEHFIFYARAAKKGDGPNPTKPMVSWNKAWYALRKEAGKKYPKLKTIRQYDLRHHALTCLLENPNISEQTIMAIAGHITPKMKERYSHIRAEQRRAAVEALGSLEKLQSGLQLVHRKVN